MFGQFFFWLFRLLNTYTLLKSSCFFLLQCAFTSLLEKLNGLPAQPQQKTKYEQRPWLSSNLAFWMANVQRRKSFQKPAKMTKTTKVLQFKSHFSFLSVHIRTLDFSRMLTKSHQFLCKVILKFWKLIELSGWKWGAILRIAIEFDLNQRSGFH